MEKKIRHLSRCAIACATFLFVQQSVQSQVSDPSTWGDFVRGSSNISVRDTFRMQTFAGAASDNWSYTTTGETSIEEISNVTDIPNDHGNYGLRMPMNTRVAFEHFPQTNYQEIKISVRKGGIRLVEGEEMRAKTYRPDEDDNNYPALVTKISESGINSFFTTNISRNPPGVDLIVPAPASNTKNGHYYVDSVYAHGMIPAYSLFTGNNDWDDADSWSHLPAYRHRNALINGDISINTDISCGDIFLGDGNIRILATGNLSANNLTIYPDEDGSTSSYGLRSSGTIDLSGQVTIEKTFAQKGKWYFVSFPFDVYASGMDPDFQLGDDKEDTNGNYLYIQTYNGEKRANSQSASANWEVVSRTIANTSQPVFQKNKGYLVAIDASADRQTLRFSSKEGKIPQDFGKNGQAAIQVTINSQSDNQKHNGWYLCGNPLPAPLALSQIEANSALDGYIYIYDGSTFQAYTIGSSFAIPPFSAFFVKADKNTSLSVHSASESTGYRLLSTDAAMSFPTSEPQTRQNSAVVSNPSVSVTEPRYQLKNKTLFITDLPSAGQVQLFTSTGKLVFTQAVQAGSSTLPIPLPQGVYILSIQAGHCKEQHKCLLAQ